MVGESGRGGGYALILGDRESCCGVAGVVALHTLPRAALLSRSSNSYRSFTNTRINKQSIPPTLTHPYIHPSVVPVSHNKQSNQPITPPRSCSCSHSHLEKRPSYQPPVHFPSPLLSPQPIPAPLPFYPLYPFYRFNPSQIPYPPPSPLSSDLESV